MTLRKRDRIVLAVVAAVALVGAFYMLALKPERQKASALQTQIATQQQALATAQQSYNVGRAAQAALKTDGAQWAALKLAVPAQSNIPALLRLLEKSADADHVAMTSLSLSGSTGASSTHGRRRPRRGTAAPSATPVPIQLTFTGGYVALNKLVRKLTGLVAVSDGTVHATGPLLSINSVTLTRLQEPDGQRHRHHLPVGRRGRHDDRRTRMSSLRRDLVERKLWMVVAILVVAVVAAPVFLLKGASASTTPTVPAPPAATATTAQTTTTDDDRLGGAGQGRAGPHRPRPVRQRRAEAELQAGVGHILERVVIVDQHDRVRVHVDDPVVVELDRAGLDGVALTGHDGLVVLERVVRRLDRLGQRRHHRHRSDLDDRVDVAAHAGGSSPPRSSRGRCTRSRCASARTSACPSRTTSRGSRPSRTSMAPQVMFMGVMSDGTLSGVRPARRRRAHRSRARAVPTTLTARRSCSRPVRPSI